jgi:hypothetical protein
MTTMGPDRLRTPNSVWPALSSGERGVDQLVQACSGEQAVECPLAGGVRDQQHVLVVPAGGQIAQEVVGWCEHLPVALPVREGRSSPTRSGGSCWCSDWWAAPGALRDNSG